MKLTLVPYLLICWLLVKYGIVKKTAGNFVARASSIELSTTSKTRWCRPVPSEVSPMYMPGRLRTASRPSRIWMLDSP